MSASSCQTPSALRRRMKPLLVISRMPEVGDGDPARTLRLGGGAATDGREDGDGGGGGGGSPALGLVEQPRSGSATRSGSVSRRRIARRPTIAAERRGEGSAPPEERQLGFCERKGAPELRRARRGACIVEEGADL